MKRFEPLTGPQARRSLAAKYSRVADRVRQRMTDYGLRPYRVWLVWLVYDGEERGDGNARVLQQVEILPTPRVTDMTALTYRSAAAGTFPEGSVRVDGISAYAFTEDELQGVRRPRPGPNGQPAPPPAGCETEGFDTSPGTKVDFCYWVQEDGRGDDPARIKRFRLMANPFRDVTGFNWTVLLARSDRDPTREGEPVNIGVGADELRRLLR